MKKCDPDNPPPDKQCKSDEEIKNWMKRRYVVVLKNQQRFDADGYEAKTTVVSESRVNWFPIASQ